jgi:hypothetical protein
MAKQSEQFEKSSKPYQPVKPTHQELAPGASQQIAGLMEGVEHRFIGMVKVPDRYTGDYYEYQNVEVTFKDGKLLYHRFVGEASPHINDTINLATQWIDRDYDERSR